MGDGLQKAFAATRATRRTPQQQADDFVRANDRSPVIIGSAIEPDPRKRPKGARYKLDDRTWHQLGAEACALLPDGYPRWKQ